MKALFFADGGPGVGLGHLRRCAALAHGMTNAGWDCAFLAYEPASVAWLSEAGAALAPARRPASGRLPDGDYRCDAFVVDSYPATNAEILARTEGNAALVLAFDDHLDRHASAEVILSSGVVAPDLPWPERSRIAHLLGPEFHPLPAEFLPLPAGREIRAVVTRVLVTLGGAASPEQFDRVVSAVRRALPDAELECAIGPFSEAPAGLSGIPRTTVVRSPASLKPLMLACDLAVASSGQTLFELAALGTPAVAIGLADNQRENLIGMERAGCVLSAGSLAAPDFERTLADRLSRASSAEVRRRLSDAGRQLVDGRGAERVAQALTDLLARRRAAR